MRVALDTNVLVSAVATRGLCADVLQLVLAEHSPVVGGTVLAELEKVLRGKMRVPPKLVAEVVALLREECEVVKAAELLAVKIRDAADASVLAEAVAGRAEILITGDRDLLSITVELPLQILTPRDFWKLLRAGSADHGRSVRPIK
ncbi:MAG: putative toxin-antitoxin system toxin component, PIN family [Steroidobacteraceae bacterium]|mgnify:CR=1 FL=1